MGLLVQRDPERFRRLSEQLRPASGGLGDLPWGLVPLFDCTLGVYVQYLDEALDQKQPRVASWPPPPGTTGLSTRWTIPIPDEALEPLRRLRSAIGVVRGRLRAAAALATRLAQADRPPAGFDPNAGGMTIAAPDGPMTRLRNLLGTSLVGDLPLPDASRPLRSIPDLVDYFDSRLAQVVS